MPDYAKLYRLLFNAMTDAIALLQKAQQEAENLYVSTPDPEVRLLRPDEQGDGE